MQGFTDTGDTVTKTPTGEGKYAGGTQSERREGPGAHRGRVALTHSDDLGSSYPLRLTHEGTGLQG